MKPALLFVYNAESGVFNALADLAHKTATYSCNLCAITFSSLGMRREWKRFLNELGTPVEFLHRDELTERFGVERCFCQRSFAAPTMSYSSGWTPMHWTPAARWRICSSSSKAG